VEPDTRAEEAEAAHVPVIVVADAAYVGQEAVAEEGGGAYSVRVVDGLEGALEALQDLDCPLVLLPHNLEPLAGAEVLARLSVQPGAFLGLLMVDEPDLRALEDARSLPGVHAILPRPLRRGALALHLRAAAAERARLAALHGGAERNDRELDELMKALRHELRGQIQGVVGLAGLLVEFERERLSEEGVAWCRRLEASGERLAALVDNVVIYLRLGRRPLEIAPIDLGELAEELLDDLRFASPLRASDLRFEGPSLRLPADRRALGAALRHLLDNALRYNSSETPSVRIGVTLGDVAGRASGGFTLWIQDDGIGVAPRARDRVFELFERDHPDDPGITAGAGVGLAVVARVAERHGGRAWLESEPGRGSTFYVYLPAEA